MNHRYYFPIWERLKKEGTVRVSANRVFHRRICKAVKKEKWMDVGHKMEIYPYYTTLEFYSENALLTITLEKRLDATKLSISDV